MALKIEKRSYFFYIYGYYGELMITYILSVSQQSDQNLHGKNNVGMNIEGKILSHKRGN